MKEKVLIQTNSKNLLYFAIGALFAGFVITLIIGAALGGVQMYLNLIMDLDHLFQ